MMSGYGSCNQLGDSPYGMSWRLSLMVQWVWRECVWGLAAVLLLSCSYNQVNTQVVATPTNISESGKNHLTRAPIDAPRLVVAGLQGKLLIERAGKIHSEPAPAGYSMYWDYSGAGTLAFASTDWQRAASGNLSVSDFWVYDYHRRESKQWIDSNVGRVLWGPDLDDGTMRAAIALFDPKTEDFSLSIVTAPGEARVVADYASYAFSWSPDGNWLAYVRRAPPAGLYLVSVDGGQARKLSDFAYQDGGWLFDKPLWIPKYNILIMSENSNRPLRAVPIDGSKEFIPAALNGSKILGPRPDEMLWAGGRRQLVLSGESGYVSETWVHTFSDDLRTVVHSILVAEATLKGWWRPEKSILLMGSTGAEVYDLPSP